MGAETVVDSDRATNSAVEDTDGRSVVDLVLRRGSIALAGDPADAVVAVASALEDAAQLFGPSDTWPVELRPLPRLVVDPVDGTLSSPYGFRRDPINKRRHKHHNGIDFDAERGDDVRAAGAGLVIKASRYYGYGRTIWIDHGNGLVSRYGHLQEIRVKEGDYVTAASLIGTVGSSGRATGPHLHFELRIDGRPIDPARVMNTRLVPGIPRLLDFLTQLVHPGMLPEFHAFGADSNEI